MKKILLILIFAWSSLAVFAQVSENQQSMSQGSNNALSVYLKKTNKKDVVKAWTKYIKKFDGKTKKNKKTGEIFSDNSEIEKMSTNTVDVYATVTEKGEDTELTVWFDLGGAFLASNTHTEGYKKGVQMLESFRLSVSKAAIEEELEAEEDKLKKLEKDLAGLQKNQKKSEDDIKKYQEKITQAEQDIKTSITNQKTKEGVIDSQREAVKLVKEKLKKLN